LHKSQIITTIINPQPENRCDHDSFFSFNRLPSSVILLMTTAKLLIICYNKTAFMSEKKLKVGWFSFTCCEDSTILFTELLNDHYQTWLPKLQFVHARVLQTKNIWGPMDVAFVEGAISSDSQAETLKKIRQLATKVVAIGACAVTGRPSGQRNDFPPPLQQEIDSILKKFNYGKKVKKLDELIKVDAAVPGCPMNEQKFIEILNLYLTEFAIN